MIWWDGDLLREIYGGFSVFKWNHESQTTTRIYSADPNPSSERRGRYSGRRPLLAADILGDWREELIVAGPDGESIRLHTTTIPTEHRITTLMHDPQYRLSIAWQNVAYDKPAHTSFFLGHDMKPPTRPAIRLAGSPKPGPVAVVPEETKEPVTREKKLEIQN